jgi:hypothetical protein
METVHLPTPALRGNRDVLWLWRPVVRQAAALAALLWLDGALPPDGGEAVRPSPLPCAPHSSTLRARGSSCTPAAHGRVHACEGLHVRSRPTPAQVRVVPVGWPPLLAAARCGSWLETQAARRAAAASAPPPPAASAAAPQTPPAQLAAAPGASPDGRAAADGRAPGTGSPTSVDTTPGTRQIAAKGDGGSGGGAPAPGLEGLPASLASVAPSAHEAARTASSAAEEGPDDDDVDRVRGAAAEGMLRVFVHGQLGMARKRGGGGGGGAGRVVAARSWPPAAPVRRLRAPMQARAARGRLPRFAASRLCTVWFAPGCCAAACAQEALLEEMDKKRQRLVAEVGWWSVGGRPEDLTARTRVCRSMPGHVPGTAASAMGGVRVPAGPGGVLPSVRPAGGGARAPHGGAAQRHGRARPGG